MKCNRCQNEDPKLFAYDHGVYYCRKCIDFSRLDVTLEEMDLFMHGEVLQKECEKGYVAVCFKGHPFGFGKSDGKQIKNKIPKGLRLLPNSHVNID